MKRDSRSHESSEVVGVRGILNLRLPAPKDGRQTRPPGPKCTRFKRFPLSALPATSRHHRENPSKTVRSELPAPPQDGLGFAVRLPPAFALTVVRLLHLEPGERAPFLV